MLWLAVHLPKLPLELIQNPANAQRAVAIVQGAPGRVLLANPAAAEQGIEAGLSESSALALCQHIELLPRQYERELLRLQSLAETAYQFSSQVISYSSRQQQHSLLIEISGSLRLYGGLESLQEAIRDAFVEHPLAQSSSGFTTQLALAKTARLSELLARYRYSRLANTDKPVQGDRKLRFDPASNLDNQLDSQLDDQLSNDLDKHDAAQATLGLVKSIPITLLDCQPSDQRHCQNMGIRQLGQLLQLPREALGRRFSRDFIRYLNQVDGREADPLPLFQAPEQFQQSLYFTSALQGHDELQAPMESLLLSLGSFLRFRQLQCTALHWQFTDTRKTKQTLDIHFSKPQFKHPQMLELSQIQVSQVVIKDATQEGIEDIALKVMQFIPLADEAQQGIEQDLFAEQLFSQTAEQTVTQTTAQLAKKASGTAKPTSEQKSALYIDGDARLLQDKIRLKIGIDALQTIQLKPRHLPEQANKLATVKQSYYPRRNTRATIKNAQEKNRWQRTNSPTSPHNSAPSQEQLSEQPLWLIEPAIAVHIEKATPRKTTSKTQQSHERNCDKSHEHNYDQSCAQNHTQNHEKPRYRLNQRHIIEILKGPERLHNNWWHKPQIRDYFIAGQLSQADSTHYEAIYWLYQNKLNQRWFLQGIF